ncbi:MAG: DUF2235 domain-containing protein [Comamonadaceae bacterium]|nr:DUF2235 domain-containing protein [Comamonadaceae bacterium]
MPRNLVVCCDGTGQVWSPAARTTNVVQLARALVRDPQRQLFYYDPGVGTPDGFVPQGGVLRWRDIARRLGGLTWGDGVWTNVGEAYLFLAEQHRPGDRIFLFGFSRGGVRGARRRRADPPLRTRRAAARNLVPALLKVYRSRAGARATTPARHSGARSRARTSASTSPASGTPSNRSASSRRWSARTSPATARSRPASSTSATRWRWTSNARRTRRGCTRRRARRCRQGTASSRSASPAPTATSAAATPTTASPTSRCTGWRARPTGSGLLVERERLDAHPANPLAMQHDPPARVPPWVLLGIFARDLPRDGIVVHETVPARMAHFGPRYRPPLPPPGAAQRAPARTRCEHTAADGGVAPWPVPATAVPAATPRQRTGARARVGFAVGAVATMLLLWRFGGEWRPAAVAAARAGGRRPVAPGPAPARAVRRRPSRVQRVAVAAARMGQRAAGRLRDDAAAAAARRRPLLRPRRRGAAVDRARRRAGAVLPLADLVENLATLKAWAAAAPAPSARCRRRACAKASGPLLAALAALTKVAALAMLIGLVVARSGAAAVLRQARPRRPRDGRTRAQAADAARRLPTPAAVLPARRATASRRLRALGSFAATGTRAPPSASTNTNRHPPATRHPPGDPR